MCTVDNFCITISCIFKLHFLYLYFILFTMRILHTDDATNNDEDTCTIEYTNKHRVADIDTIMSYNIIYNWQLMKIQMAANLADGMTHKKKA